MTELKFSQDAELAILNIIFCSPDVIYSLVSLKPFMFSSTPNSLIYSTILELADRGLLPDFNLVATNLNSNGKIKEAGGVDYLTYIRNLVYKKDNLKEFERQVIDNYKTTAVLSIVSNTQGKIRSGEPVAEVISDIKHQLDSVEETSGGEQVVDFMQTSQETWRSIVERVENPGIRGITTGFKDIDMLTGGYNPGDLWVVAGRPGMGKSTDMCNSALAVAQAGHPILIFSLEMNKSALAERIISMKSGIPLADIRLGALSKDQMNKISDTIREIKSLPIYIDTNFDADQEYFSITTRKFKTLKGIKVVFFDYVQLASERGANQTAEIGAFSRTAKLLANDLGITSILYSQLNRAVELREDKRPILSDLRQSGNLEEDADIAMFLYRDQVYYPETTKYKGVLEKLFRKHRNGPTGTIFCKMDENTLRIYEERGK